MTRYEHRKHDGSLPLGVNTFLPKEHAGDIVTEIELIRSTEGEKGQQIDNVARYQALRNAIAPPSTVRPERSPQGEVEGPIEPVRPERSAEGAKS